MQCLNDLDALLLDTPRVRKGDARFAADFEIKFAKTRCAIADTLRELTAERDALAAELARVRGELAAVPVREIRKVCNAAEMDGYTNGDVEEWLIELELHPQA